MKIKFSYVLLNNIINAEKKSMLSKWSHCDDQVKVQSSIQNGFGADLGLVSVRWSKNPHHYESDC